MRYLWIVFITFMFCVFIFFLVPIDNQIYEDYLNNTYIQSKGNFVSKKHFEVEYQVVQKNKSSGGSSSQPTNPDKLGGSAAESNPGVAQCPWSNAAGVTLSSDEFIEVCREVVGDADTYINAFGMTPQESGIDQAHDFDTWRDKFSDGVGVIHYFQGVGSWASMRHKFAYPDHVSPFSSSGCGSTAMSIIFSTMMHRYITPAEIAAGVGTYNQRYGAHQVFHTMSKGAGAMDQSSNLELVFEDPKYNGQSILKCEHVATIMQDKVDATLEAGGMVMWVSVGSKKTARVWASGSGHWVVIRDKDPATGLYYCADGANSSGTVMEATRAADPQTGNTFETIKAAAKAQVFYVTPGPGYNDFINASK